jgi:hypothetical protein
MNQKKNKKNLKKLATIEAPPQTAWIWIRRKIFATIEYHAIKRVLTLFSLHQVMLTSWIHTHDGCGYCSPSTVCGSSEFVLGSVHSWVLHPGAGQVFCGIWLFGFRVWNNTFWIEKMKHLAFEDSRTYDIWARVCVKLGNTRIPKKC